MSRRTRPEIVSAFTASAKSAQGAHHTVLLRSVEHGATAPHPQWVIHCFQGAAAVVFTPLVQFFIDIGSHENLSWQKTTAQGVGLFLDFLLSSPPKTVPANAFRKFAIALKQGTIDLNGEDAMGLFWLPRSAGRARVLLARATQFADWLANRTGNAALNPTRALTPAERIVAANRAHHQRPRDLLAHTRRAPQRTRSVTVSGRTPVVAIGSEIDAFDPKRMETLLNVGFRGAAPNKTTSAKALKDRMITVLMHGAGLRMCEAFHLFTEDVVEDPAAPGCALVRLYHPEYGAPPPGSVAHIVDRTQFLKEVYGITPRNRDMGRFHAGWKNLLLTHRREHYARIHWFPQEWGRIFWQLYCRYVNEVRAPSSRHPFLFTSDKSGVRGDPYTTAAFKDAYRHALARMGLKQSRAQANHPHSHRHAYGVALAAAGLAPRVIQHAMHHRSPFSQQAYTNLSSSKIARALRVAEVELDRAQPIATALPRLDGDDEAQS